MFDDNADIDVVNEWVTNKRMETIINIARTVLNTPIKGITIDTNLHSDDGDIIGDIMISQIQEETKKKLIFTDSTEKAIREAVKIWFIDYIKGLTK